MQSFYKLQDVELLQDVEILQDLDHLQDVKIVQDLQDVELLQGIDIDHLKVLAFLNACSIRFKVGIKDLSLVFPKLYFVEAIDLKYFKSC